MSIDYQEIFNKEKSELVAKGLLPTPDGISDDENQVAIDALTERSRLLEQAIEELRIRKHAVEHAKDERKSKLSSDRRRKQDESDMEHRQKKQVDKLDKAVQMKKLQAATLTATLRAINMSDEDIKAMLEKKGLL